MSRSRFTQEQIAFALRQAESGTSVGEVCRKMGVSENTFYRWKRKFEGLGVAEIMRLRLLEEETAGSSSWLLISPWTRRCFRTSFRWCTF